MINTLVSHKYEVGTEVELVENYNHLKAGWHGTIRKAGITKDRFSYEYVLEDDNGNKEIIIGNFLRPYIQGARNNIEKIISNMTIFIEDEDELKDFKKAYSIIERDFRGYTLAVAMYGFGKMIGRNNERLDRKRKKLMKNYPDMREPTKKASNKAITTAFSMENLSNEEIDLFIDYLNKRRG